MGVPIVFTISTFDLKHFAAGHSYSSTWRPCYNLLNAKTDLSLGNKFLSTSLKMLAVSTIIFGLSISNNCSKYLEGVKSWSELIFQFLHYVIDISFINLVTFVNKRLETHRYYETALSKDIRDFKTEQLRLLCNVFLFLNAL